LENKSVEAPLILDVVYGDCKAGVDFPTCLFYKGAFKGQFEDKEATMKIFNDHIEEVKRHVPEDRLLVFSVKDAWEPLCKFLEGPVPDTEFPHINDRESMQKAFKKRSEQIEAGVDVGIVDMVEMVTDISEARTK